MTVRGPSRVLAILGALVITAVSCGGSESAPRRTIIDLGRDAGAGIPTVDPDRHDVLDAGTLRLTVEQLLAGHGLSATALMRAASVDAPDVDARLEALAANTRDLTGAIGMVYGPVGARAFEQLWSQHTQAFLDYASATGDDERAVARSHLRDYEHDFASFVATATAGAASVDAVRHLLEQHNGQMLEQLDAMRAGDATRSIDLTVASMDYLAVIGQALSSAFAAQQPDAFPGPSDDATLAFCSLVGRTGATAAALVTVPAGYLGGRLRVAALARLPQLPEQAVSLPGADAFGAALEQARRAGEDRGTTANGSEAAHRALRAAYELAAAWRVRA